MTAPGDITELFEAAADGDEAAFDRVIEKVYTELVNMAGRQMRQRFGSLDGLTLEPTAVVNETILKLLPGRPEFVNRRHFFAFASKVMRRVLIDYQRARGREKRGGDRLRVTLTDLGADAATPPTVEASQIVDVIEQLESLDARKGEIAQLRLFWGLEMTEIAETLEVSLSTVERDWRFSRSWLARALEAA